MANYHHVTTTLRQRSADAGRKWAIFCDEQTDASHGVLPDADDPTHDIPRKLGLWGNLMGGGSGVEWYFGFEFPHMDINCEDWRSRDIMWDQTRHGLEFFQNYLPFWEMEPLDHLLLTKNGHCFAKAGEIYAVYLPEGGSAELDIEDSNAEYEVKWYNPRMGGELIEGKITSVQGSGKVNLGEAPIDPDKDWAILLRQLK
jgi:hypothetical protein